MSKRFMRLRRSKSHSKSLIILLIIIALPIFGYWQYKNLIVEPIDPTDSSTISFQVKKGSTVKEIAVDLEEKAEGGE